MSKIIAYLRNLARALLGKPPASTQGGGPGNPKPPV